MSQVKKKAATVCETATASTPKGTENKIQVQDTTQGPEMQEDIKFALSSKDLQYIFRALKPAVRSDFKRSMMYMKLECRGDKLYATSCDGYEVHRVVVPVKSTGPCTIYILPFQLPKGIQGEVLCIVDQDQITFDFGGLKISVERQEVEFLDVDAAIPVSEIRSSICIDAQKLIDVAKAFRPGRKGQRCLRIETHGPREPIVIHNVGRPEEYGLVLPMRDPEGGC